MGNYEIALAIMDSPKISHNNKLTREFAKLLTNKYIINMHKFTTSLIIYFNG